MPKELQKRIITSAILLILLIFFNFSKFFIIGVFIAVLIICLEFNEILSKIIGPDLIKRRKSGFAYEKVNLKFLIFQLFGIFYVLIIFGGSLIELHGRSGSPVFFSFCFIYMFFF